MPGRDMAVVVGAALKEVMAPADNLAAGTELIREGATQDRLYVVVSGKIALTARRGDACVCDRTCCTT